MTSSLRRLRSVATIRLWMLRSLAALVLLCSSVSAFPVEGPSPDEPPLLEPGNAIERPLSGGQMHAYRLRFDAGQFVHVEVEQKGIDVVLVLSDAAKELRRVDGSQEFVERLSEVGESGGFWRLEIRSADAQVPSGAYRLRLDSLRPATPADRTRVAAERRHDEALQILAQGSAEAKQKAIVVLKESATLWAEIHDENGRGMVLKDLADIYQDLGELKRSIEILAEALELFRLLGNAHLEAAMENNLAWSYGRLGEGQKTLEHLERALALDRRLSKRADEAAVLGSIGWAYRNLGMGERALDFLTQSLQMNRDLGNRDSQATILNNIGLVYDDRGDYQKAVDAFKESLALCEGRAGCAAEAPALGNLGFAYSHLEDREKALDYYGQALRLCRKVGERYGEGYVLTNMAAVYNDSGDPARALSLLAEALPIRRAVGDLEGEALTLRQMSRAKRILGKLSEARGDLEASLADYEILRNRGANPAQRASFFTLVRAAFETSVDLLMEMHAREPEKGFDRLAFETSERARARSLLELLFEAKENLRGDVDPSLLDREDALRRALRDAVETQMTTLAGKHSETEIAAAAKAVESTQADLERAEAEIRTKSPRYSDLTGANPRSVAEIQRQLDSDTVLLEYSLGKERSFVWAVTPTSLSSFELPRRETIEAAARAYYESVSAGRAARSAKAGKGRVRPAPADSRASLAGMLLGPVSRELARKRIVVVAEGALLYVPFAALPDPSASEEGRVVPLVAEHEILSLPSASVLELLRRESAGRLRPDATLAVLADPVFDERDERVQGGEKKRVSRSAGRPRDDALTRSAGEAGVRDADGRLPRLLYSRREAESILALAPERSRMKALDFNASLATATGPDLARYRIVHFATHGLLNSAHPELSGLVLSLVDRKGRPQPGFLTAAQIYGLTLPADLVVLSGCRTALGKEIRGEGLIGLTRGFMYAGARGVLASLWSVHDAATAELMKRFYAGMLGGEHLTPAAALARAQREMAASALWKDPTYWAGFVLQGDWKN
jgi:CHAT domain-containing protein/Tfp pilus assembly protein PilF